MNFVKINKSFSIKEEISIGKYSAEFQYLISKFKLDETEIIEKYKFLPQNGNLSNMQNITCIFVKYLFIRLNESLYKPFQEILENFIILSKARSILDIGFTLLDNYVKTIIKSNPKLRNLNKLTLVSSNKLNIEFATGLLKFMSPHWRKYIIFFEEHIENMSRTFANQDLIIFRDLEYSKNNIDQYLYNYLQNTKKTAMFLFVNTLNTNLAEKNLDGINKIKQFLYNHQLGLKEEKIIDIISAANDVNQIYIRSKYITLWYKL